MAASSRPAAGAGSAAAVTDSAAAPLDAYSRKARSPATPSAAVRVTSISSGRSELKTTISSRARLTATLSRRHPPSRFSGPKLSETRPEASRP